MHGSRVVGVAPGDLWLDVDGRGLRDYLLLGGIVLPIVGWLCEVGGT